VSYQYDTVSPIGRGYLASVSNSKSTTNYLTYDELGRVSSSNQQTGGSTYTFNYKYDLAGALIYESYPSGREVTTAYDGADRAFTVAGQLFGVTTNYIAGTTYAPHGAISTLSYSVVNANNNHSLASELGYDNRLRQSVQWVMLDGSSDHYLFTENASYFGNNNLSSGAEGYGSNVPFASLAWFTQSYTYDKVNRLAAANDNGWSRTFAYDPFGNLSVAPGTGNSISVASTNLYDPTTNRIKNNGVQYDAAGNQIFVNGNTLAYDAENRQSDLFDSVTKDNELYLYDGDGRRVAKQDGGNGTGSVFVYDAMGQLAAEYFTPVMSNPCATCYLISDRIGSTRLVTDIAGNVVSRHDYLAFGEEIGSYSAGRNGQWGPIADNITQKFTAKERDAESGLDYFGARYYGSALGRFTSADPKLIPDAFDNPQSWNKYAYTGNNPLRYTDPDGKDWKDVVAGTFNAVWSDNTLGAGRQTGNSDFRTGQAIGDGIAFVQGGVQILLGAAGDIGGGLLTGTGVGAAVGVPAVAVSTAVAADGVAVGSTAAANLIVAASSNQGTSGGDRAGKSFTSKGKQEVKSQNASANDGQTTCSECGQSTIPGQQSQSGVTPPGNETHVDHIIPKSAGGDGSPSNGQVLCRTCNLQKNDKVPGQN
jgi:RHS repeat-associated protein